MIFDELINDKNTSRARAFKVADDKTVLFCHLVWFVCVDANKFLWLSGRVLRYQRKGCGFDSQGTHVPTKICITWMHCKSLWIKASDKCINVSYHFVFIIIVLGVNRPHNHLVYHHMYTGVQRFWVCEFFFYCFLIKVSHYSSFQCQMILQKSF